MPAASLRVEVERDRAAREAHLERLEVDLGLARLHQGADLLLGQHNRQEPDLRAVGEEDVGEARRHDRLEAVVLERPRRVLAARAAAEVRSRGEDRVRREVPARLLRPVVEEELAEAGPLHPLEELLGDDLVRVDVGAVEHADGAGDGRDRLHHRSPPPLIRIPSDGVGDVPSPYERMSTKWPSTAAAAAISGETRWVRPPRPW